MRSVKQYDGTTIATHTVRTGDSLSSIAREYKFQSWRPIWVFNTQVRHVLTSGNPDRIPADVNIFIPRSERGYRDLIKKLHISKIRIEGSLDRERWRLEADWDAHELFREKLYLTGDLATSAALIGWQARQTFNVARAAEKVVGRGAPAAEYLARIEAKKLGKMLQDKAIDAVAQYLPNSFKTPTQQGIRTIRTMRKSIDAVRNSSMHDGRTLLDVADIVLDYLKPSNLAEGWIIVVRGEATKSSYKRAQELLSKAAADSSAQIARKIRNLDAERNLLYKSNAANSPAAKPPTTATHSSGSTDWSELDKAIFRDDEELKEGGLNDFLGKK